MTSWYSTLHRWNLGHRLLLVVGGIAIATLLLLSVHGTANADSGFYRQRSWNWVYTTRWDWNWDRNTRWDWNWTHWDDDWYASRGTWGNYGLWFGYSWYHGVPCIFTFEKPVYLPRYHRWIVFHDGRPVLSTPYRPIYRPIGNVWVIVNVSNASNVNIDIDVNAYDDFNYVYWSW
jgi:hypothetical protein